MKKLLFVAIMASTALFAGCNRETITVCENESNPGSLKVSIQYATSATRAQGFPASEDESRVHSFTVYVFHYSTGVTERVETFTNVIEGEIIGLTTASTKRVVVLVNDDFTNTADIGNYSDLVEGVFDISTQDPADLTTKGLFMSGEYPDEVALSTTAQTVVPVTVRRVVAKVILESLTIEAESDSEFDKLEIISVNLQRVPASAYLLTDQIPTLADTDYRGGLGSGSISTALSSLNQPYSLPTGFVNGDTDAPEIYFYTFPNDNSNEKATMMSFYATYDGVDVYYTFVINDTAGAQSDGTWIQRNKVYALNVTLINLGLGGNDPDTTNYLADLVVEVTVIDWEDEVIQDVVW